jgi:hypothetical protein
MRATSNPALIADALERLNAVGMKKGFFQNSNQFLYDCFVSNQTGAEVLLRKTMLSGPQDNNGCIQVWTPWGTFAGAEGYLAVHDFSDRKWQRIWLIVLIDPFFDRLADLLEPPK